MSVERVDQRRTRVRPGVYSRTNGNGSVVYEISYRDSDGSKRRETVGPRLKEAESRLAQVKADMSRGAQIVPNTMTVAEAAARFMDSLGHLAPSTIAHYSASLSCHVLPAFGRRRLDAVTADDLARWIQKARGSAYAAAHGREKPYRAATVNRALGTLNRVYSHARRRQGFLGNSPVLALERSERPRDEPKEMAILTPEEAAAVVASAKDRYKPVLEFLVGTGCRVNEALGLTWGDLDLHERTVRIMMQVNRQGQRVGLKTRYSRRTLDMSGSLVRSLAALKLAARDTGSDAFVFSSSGAGPMSDRNVANRGLTPACVKAGLPVVSPHGLRHAHGSALLADGWELPAVSRRLGHSSVAITAHIYAHVLEDAERRRNRRDRLDGLYGGGSAAGG